MKTWVRGGRQERGERGPSGRPPGFMGAGRGPVRGRSPERGGACGGPGTQGPQRTAPLRGGQAASPSPSPRGSQGTRTPPGARAGKEGKPSSVGAFPSADPRDQGRGPHPSRTWTCEAAPYLLPGQRPQRVPHPNPTTKQLKEQNAPSRFLGLAREERERFPRPSSKQTMSAAEAVFQRSILTFSFIDRRLQRNVQGRPVHHLYKHVIS